MIWKFTPLTIVVGITACGLLAFRQGRIDAAHDMLQLQERLRINERLLLDVRAELRSQLNLARVRTLCDQLARRSGMPFISIRVEDCVRQYDEYRSVRVELDHEDSKRRATPSNGL